MADTLHSYVRQDTTPKDDRDNLLDQKDRELESYRHNPDQPKDQFNDDFEKAPEQTNFKSGMTMRDTLSSDVGGDATHSAAPSRPRTHTFGKRKSRSRSRGYSRGLENGRER